MSTSGFMRVKTLAGASKVLTASRHNKRAIQAERGATGHIDASRMELNYCLHGPGTPSGVAQHAKALMAAANVRPRRKNAVLAIEIVFSLPRDTTIELETYFRDCLKWVTEHFCGLENVLSADVHLDESAPHMHVLILPLMDGRMKGSELCGNRQRFQYLQTTFHGAVAGPHGLPRARARLRGQAREKAVSSVLGLIRSMSDSAQTSALWPVIRDWIDSDPAPAALALGIQVDEAPPPKLRTVAQIMTSTGKGPRTRETTIGVRKPAPIESAALAKVLPLCSVGVATKPPAPAQIKAPADPDECDDRVIDRSECEFSEWPD